MARDRKSFYQLETLGIFITYISLLQKFFELSEQSYEIDFAPRHIVRYYRSVNKIIETNQ